MKSISDIKHAFYINLETRPDRKEHVEKQMELIGIKATRFNAIRLKNGALGCSMSHLKILENAKKNNLEHVLIVEDDILFTTPIIFTNQLNKFLSNHPKFDVVLVAGNNMPPYTEIDDTCIQIKQCQTTTGYLVQNHYFDTLIANYREGIQKLMNEPQKPGLYAIDKYWFSLQQKDKWYLITPLTVTQREDYSDIEKRTTDYSRAMLDIDKEAFFKWQMEQYMKSKALNMGI